MIKCEFGACLSPADPRYGTIMEESRTGRSAPPGFIATRWHGLSMIDYGNMTIDEIADEVLEGKSPGEIEREIIESDRPDVTQKSVRYRDESKTVSPHTVEVSGVAPRALDRVHANRSAREQTVDEQKSARLTRDYDTWASDPARFDFPGVDSRKESFGTTVDTDLFGDLAPEKWG